MGELSGWANAVRRGLAPSAFFYAKKYCGWTKAQPYDKYVLSILGGLLSAKPPCGTDEVHDRRAPITRRTRYGDQWFRSSHQPIASAYPG